MWMGAPSAAVVDMWRLLTIQIFLVTAADARNCFAWAVGLTLWLRDRRFFPNFDAAIYPVCLGALCERCTRPYLLRQSNHLPPRSAFPLSLSLSLSYILVAPHAGPD